MAKQYKKAYIFLFKLHNREPLFDDVIKYLYAKQSISKK